MHAIYDFGTMVNGDTARTQDSNDEAAGEEELLTARTAAERLGVKERTVRRAIARGQLRAVKRAGVFRITATDLAKFQSYRSRDAGILGDGADGGPPAIELRHPEPHHLFLLPGHPRNTPTSLPVSLTSFVGREREVVTLVAALRQEPRLLTLTGPGGVGKTRLALMAATEVAAAFPDGVWHVDLSSLSDHELVAPTIAHVLGVRETGAELIGARLESALQERNLLLVLDNFEQVVEAAPLVAGLLAACPLLRIMVTSRVRLRVSGEREYAVPPLGLADRVEPGSNTDAVESEAVRLFVERAQSAADGFVLTPEHETAVTAICRRLDGLPLAIELAAAWTKVLSPVSLLSRLDRRLALLTGGPRDAPARLRTMRDAIAWSYDLLTANEQVMFRRLAVFVGGFTIEAAEALSLSPSVVRPLGRSAVDVDLGEVSSHDSVLDIVAALVDKSLLRVDGTAGGAPRYGMLETIREFGLEQLAASGEVDAVRQRHADWCLAFAADAGPRATRPGADAWLASLEREYPNLRSVLTWLVERRDGPRLVRLAASLWPFWQEHSYFGEGYRWLEVALEVGHAAPAADRIRALTGAGTLAWYQTRLEQALAWHEQALALAREVGDQAAEAFALINLAAPAIELGDHDRGFASLEAGLDIARGVGATEAMALALHNLACLAWIHGDHTTARHRADEALALARAHGWDWLVPGILVNFGLATVDLGNHEQAAALLREGLELGSARGNLGDVSGALEGLARVEAATGAARAAARLFGAAATLREEIDMLQTPTDRAYYQVVLTALREDLGPESFAAAWAAGRSMRWQDAMAEVLVRRDAREQLTTSGAGRRAAAPLGLSKRELDVLRLLAAGARNREIGERLFISRATVATHVANIYAKLGVDSRAKATAYAHRHELD